MGLAGAALQYTSWLRRHNAALQAEVDRADRYAGTPSVTRARPTATGSWPTATPWRRSCAWPSRPSRPASSRSPRTSSTSVAPDPRAGEPGDFAWHYLRRLARRELVRLPERSARLGSMALAGDGKTAAAWYNDATIVLWDLASERPSRTIGPVNCGNLALSEDGRILAAEQGKLGDDPFERVTVWDTRTGRVLGQYAMDPADRQRPSWVQLLAGGRVLASKFLDADQTYSVRTHRIAVDPEPAPAAPGTKLDAARLRRRFLPGADFFVTREGSRLSVRDAFTGAVRRELPGAFDGALEPAISRMADTWPRPSTEIPSSCSTWSRGPSGRVAASDSRSPTSRLSPDGDVLAGVDRTGLVHVWDLRSGSTRVIRPDNLERGREPHVPVFSPDGSRMATATWGDPGGRQPAAVWETATGRRLGVLPYADGCARPAPLRGRRVAP